MTDRGEEAYGTRLLAESQRVLIPGSRLYYARRLYNVARIQLPVEAAAFGVGGWLSGFGSPS